MLEIDIGVEKFYTLDSSINVSKRLEMPLDQMRIEYPLQDKDEQSTINTSLSESVQPTTTNFINIPSTNAYLIKPDQPSTLHSISLSSTSTSLIKSNQSSTSHYIYLPSTSTSLNESEFILIDGMPYEYSIENLTSQTTELPTQDELIQQNASTSYQNGSRLPPQKKLKNIEKRYKCNYPNCDKAYFRSDHLNEHKKSKHENRIWQCENCKNEFTTTRGKDKHLITYPEHIAYKTYL